MTIKGKVIHVGTVANGLRKSDGQPWKKQEFAIETEGKYPTKVAFSLMNAKLDEANLQMNQIVEVELNPSSREYNGKWYTELTAWRVNNLGYAQPAMNQQPVYQQQAPQGYVAQPSTPSQPLPNQVNDMPF